MAKIHLPAEFKDFCKKFEALAYGQDDSRVFDDMLICELPGMQLFFLPRRAAADDAQWREAVRRLSGGGR